MIEGLAALLGPGGLLTGADMAGYLTDWRGLFHGAAVGVARPGSTAQAVDVVRWCAAHGVPMVPQGGNTSMVGGATPSAAGDALVISLERMRAVRGVDPVDLTMTVEAGMPLAAARAAADEAGCVLPLSIAAEGSARIGGVLATNAGGTMTLRHGNARDLVLGLEVVLPDGSVWDGLRRLRKDNTGYALRHLFVGSEGTLGLITAAVLRLARRPAARAVAFCALASAEAVLELLVLVSEGGVPEAFEYMSGAGLELVLATIPGTSRPVADAADHWVLVELAGPVSVQGMLEAALETAIGSGLVLDAALAASEAQRATLWRLREEHSEAQRRAGASVKNDVAVPVSAIPTLLERATAACHAILPGAVVVPFGHAGDGNIHFNIVQEPGAAAVFLARAEALVAAVTGIVRELGGTFAAEHGIGQIKTGLLSEWRGGPELEVMRRIKSALDPAGLMNPGKVFGPG